MKCIEFSNEKDGFYGAYWKTKKTSSYAVLAFFGDDAKDYLARKAASWLNGKQINVLTMSPAKKDYSFHNFPLEKIVKAIAFLKKEGNKKIGIFGASTTGTLALTVASYFSDISLTIALTPSDFIWQGFCQGKKDGCSEWPIENESLFTYQGKMLPYIPFTYKHPDYWHVIEEESKKNKDMINSVKIFDEALKKHPLTEEETIKIENIKGQLLIIGARDDALWNTAEYIERMKGRLKEKNHDSISELIIYEHGTHYVFPESFMKKMLPIGSGLFVKLAFNMAKKFPKECKETRIDIDNKINKTLENWMQEK